MTLDDTMRALALALRDTLDETSSDALEKDPEEAYEDLVCRFVLKLSRRNLTICPAVDAKYGKAAMRIFEIFTGWFDGRPERHYITGVDRSGKFEIIVREAGATTAYFRGETIQDAYAQAAQTISFNGGSIDEEKAQAQS